MIVARDIRKEYRMGGTTLCALDGAEMTVPQGSFTAIVGGSGSGKSTLLNILGLLDRCDSGQYILNGCDVGNLPSKKLAELRSQLLGFVFQSYNLLPKMTAEENVELGLMFRDISGKNRRKLAREALEAVGLADRLSHLPCEMSGGQQQRAAIARAIAGSPQLILADEPTGNLDAESSAAIMKLLTDQNKSGVTLLLITHSAEVAAMADRVYRMENGRLYLK